jgi:hypothetical protein
MTAIKLLSTALIATFMFTIPAVAHENAATKRCVEMKDNTSASSTDCWNYSRAYIPAPHVGQYAMRPHDEPGGICDHGDNAMIC